MNEILNCCQQGIPCLHYTGVRDFAAESYHTFCTRDLNIGLQKHKGARSPRYIRNPRERVREKEARQQSMVTERKAG